VVSGEPSVHKLNMKPLLLLAGRPSWIVLGDPKKFTGFTPANVASLRGVKVVRLRAVTLICALSFGNGTRSLNFIHKDGPQKVQR
jgi:hypothetical protein